jgi:hypothetical protein
MQPQKGKDFVKSLRELNAALSSIIQNIRKDIDYLEKSIANSRQALRRPYLDKELKGTALYSKANRHLN